MQSQLKTVLEYLSLLTRTLGVVQKATGKWTLLWLLLLLIDGLLPAGSIYAVRILVDRVAEIIQSSATAAFEPIVWPALVLGALYLLGMVVENGIGWLRLAQAELVSDHLAVLIHNKSASVDIAFYETPEYHDHLQRAREDAMYLPSELLHSMGELMQHTITLIAMGALLIPYGWQLALALLISTLPAFGVVLMNHRSMHAWWKAATVQQRWAHYYDSVLTRDESAAEVRLFNLGPHFVNAYQQTRKALREGRLALMLRHSLLQLGASLVAALIAAAAAVWVLWRAMQGTFSLGDLVLMQQAFSQGQGLLHSLLGSLGQLYRHMLFLNTLYEFLDLPPQVQPPAAPKALPSQLAKDIHFHNVTFAYPGSPQPALRDFSLTLPAGQMSAIVGDNGAGKSTLVKLLCRFYDPQAGAVTFDGVDLREIAPAELHQALSVMFQRPVQYHATAAANIGMGSHHFAFGQTELVRAAQGAGVHQLITELPQGYDTLLGKWFTDGTNLSGGEWQRVALARAFLRQADILLLDEPTSAMDPWAEAEWLDRLNQIVGGRTTVLITHRFTTAMRADVIFVMRHGQIVESGSHRELLAQNGLYAESWRQQIQDRAEL